MSELIDRQQAIDKITKRLFETAFNNVGIKQNIDETLVDVAENRLENWFNDVPSVQPESTRTFVELVAKYPDPELCTYKEYKGKPYYSIKYVENGETYIGYGTYNPEVLSQYLKEYFILSAQPERKKVLGQMMQVVRFADFSRGTREIYIHYHFVRTAVLT